MLLKSPNKMSAISLWSTIIVFSALWLFLSYVDFSNAFVMVFGKYFIMVALPFLLINPLVGFIYTFFMDKSSKIVYGIIHFVFICTVSVFAFISIMFRYFVPFGP